MTASETVVAVATSIQALVVVAAAIIAGSQLVEARDARRNRERPFVVVEFDVFRRLPFIYLVVKNYGATLARDISIVFDPPLASAIEVEETRVADLGFIVDGIPSLAPGREIETLFDSFIQRQDAGLADRYTVTVQYRGDDDHQWTDTVVLDLDIYRRLSYISEKDLGDIHKVLEKMRDEMRKWTAGQDGIHIRTDGDLEDAQRWRKAEATALRSRMNREARAKEAAEPVDDV